MSDRPTPGHDDRQGEGYVQPPAAMGPAALGASAAMSPEAAACTVRAHGLVLEEDIYLDPNPDPTLDALELWERIAEIAAYQIESAAPEGEAPKKEVAVDWRARSQGLEDAGKNIRFWLGKLVDEAEVLGDEMDAPVKWRTEIQGVTHTSLRTFLARYDEALSLGLPDEEGEGESNV